MARETVLRVKWPVYMYGLPAALWGGVLLGLAIAPSLGPIEEVQLFEQQDKVYHGIEYIVLAALTALALIRGTRRSREWVLGASFAFPAVYGVFLEVIQLLVPTRDASLLDALANVVGAALGALITVYLIAPWLGAFDRPGRPRGQVPPEGSQ